MAACTAQLSRAQQSTPAVSAQQSDQRADPQKGTVLFERHEPAAGSEPNATAQDEPAPVQPTTKHGRRRALQRRESQDVQTVAPSQSGSSTTHTDAAAAMSSSDDTGTSAEEETKSSPVLPALQDKGAEAFSDPDRKAVRIERTDLDVHLNRHTGEIAARARLLVRNAGTGPLLQLPIQISSALRWQSATLQGASPQRLNFEQHRLTTDADHTGAADEAVFTLPAALRPGKAVALEVFYAGSLRQNADRLLRLGAPAERAAQSDWDTVTDSFTGLRGYGNVLWFPVSSISVFLADGASFASTVDAQRAVTQTFSLRLTAEGQGTAASQAFFLGHPAKLTEVPGPAEAAQNVEPATVQTAEWPSMAAGPHPVSLFFSSAVAAPAQSGIRVATDSVAVQEAYRSAAGRVRPMLENWLGPRPSANLSVIDLPVQHGQPFTDGGLLVLPLAPDDPKVLAPALVYPLAAASLPAGLPPWLEEGLPEFLRLLYLEQTGGHDSLLAELNVGQGPLARQESFRTNESLPLTECADSVCARTKSAFVLNMLRQVAGEQPLQQAIVALLASPVAEPLPLASISSSSATAQPGDPAASMLLSLVNKASAKDLGWFFQDWIERDVGLPDLTIVSVAPRKVERSTRTDYLPSQRRSVAGPIGAEPVAQAGDPQKSDSASESSRDRVALAEGSWLVAVAVRNDGDAAAEVPVTVRAAGLQNSLPLRIPAHGIATVRVPFEAVPEEVWVNDGSTPEVRSVTHHRAVTIPAEAR